MGCKESNQNHHDLISLTEVYDTYKGFTGTGSTLLSLTCAELVLIVVRKLYLFLKWGRISLTLTVTYGKMLKFSHKKRDYKIIFTSYVK